MDSHPISIRVLRAQHQQDAAANGICHLGETYSACVRTENITRLTNSLILAYNESTAILTKALLHIEIQTPSSQLVLAEVAIAEGRTLGPGESIETKIDHEIKEPGVHALACYCTYAADDPVERTFRQIHKFTATNPLSVKTKVHASRLATDQYSATEKDAFYLEVQVQNISNGPLAFGKMVFEPAKGLKAEDANTFPEGIETLQQGDTRQYLYITKPIEAPFSGVIAKAHTNGVLALGKLDIAWTSAFGLGRLQTAQLTKRMLPPQNSDRGLSTGDGLDYSLVLTKPENAQAAEPFEVQYVLRVSPISSTSIEEDTSLELSIQAITYSSNGQGIEADLASAVQSPKSNETTNSDFPPSLSTRPIGSYSDMPELQPTSEDLLSVLGPNPQKLPTTILSAASIDRESTMSTSTGVSTIFAKESTPRVSPTLHIPFTIKFSAKQPGIVNIGGLRIYRNGKLVKEIDATLAQIHVK